MDKNEIVTRCNTKHLQTFTKMLALLYPEDFATDTSSTNETLDGSGEVMPPLDPIN